MSPLEAPIAGFGACTEADGYEDWSVFSQPEFVKAPPRRYALGSVHLHGTDPARRGGLLSEPIPITGGETYRVSVKVHEESGANAQFYLRFQDVESTQLVNAIHITPDQRRQLAGCGCRGGGAGDDEAPCGCWAPALRQELRQGDASERPHAYRHADV